MAESSQAELRTIVKGSPERVMILDRFGKEHELCPLSLADLVEYEDKTGASLLAVERDFKLKDLAYLLYLSLRKEGLSPEQVEKRAYRVSEHSVYSLFDLKLLAQAKEVILDLLRVSGLTVPKEEDKSPLAAGEVGQTRA